ncbi:hypothetical protein DFJ74DRAFT_22558 [Hyaloraphidium curvatum]|nr:hypothetical protein DFJ74DRAFT_22558 [Hyaloraphidium curvatum]
MEVSRHITNRLFLIMLLQSLHGHAPLFCVFVVVEKIKVSHQLLVPDRRRAQAARKDGRDVCRQERLVAVPASLGRPPLGSAVEENAADRREGEEQGDGDRGGVVPSRSLARGNGRLLLHRSGLPHGPPFHPVVRPPCLRNLSNPTQTPGFGFGELPPRGRLLPAPNLDHEPRGQHHPADSADRHHEAAVLQPRGLKEDGVLARGGEAERGGEPGAKDGVGLVGVRGVVGRAHVGDEGGVDRGVGSSGRVVNRGRLEDGGVRMADFAQRRMHRGDVSRSFEEWCESGDGRPLVARREKELKNGSDARVGWDHSRHRPQRGEEGLVNQCRRPRRCRLVQLQVRSDDRQGPLVVVRCRGQHQASELHGAGDRRQVCVHQSRFGPVVFLVRPAFQRISGLQHVDQCGARVRPPIVRAIPVVAVPAVVVVRAAVPMLFPLFHPVLLTAGSVVLDEHAPLARPVEGRLDRPGSRVRVPGVERGKVLGVHVDQGGEVRAGKGHVDAAHVRGEQLRPLQRSVIVGRVKDRQVEALRPRAAEDPRVGRVGGDRLEGEDWPWFGHGALVDRGCRRGLRHCGRNLQPQREAAKAKAPRPSRSR